MSKNGEIRRDEVCVDSTPNGIQLYVCHGMKGNQFWTYNEKTKHLKNGIRCMAINEEKNKVYMEYCDDVKLSQKWILENFNSTRIAILSD